MINILSYVGMSLQSEVCLWTVLGLVRTIFDATLFKVNANLKQVLPRLMKDITCSVLYMVWQMSMPEELSLPVQRVLRTMISGIMLVQCFTVYVYLASYIVLLYPVFLEERPTLVLPWLLLAAIRKLLCELTSLALGLGTCVLLGPARPPCIKFVVIKVVSIMPVFYMWMLLYSYYHILKVASAFKSFPAVLPPSEHDYGLELAVRRRRTKSLLGEEQVRTSLIEHLYSERNTITSANISQRKPEYSSRMTHATSIEDLQEATNILRPLSTTSNRMISDIGFEDWFGNDVMIPRDTDRVLEQFGIMMLRIGAYLRKEGADANDVPLLNSGPVSSSDYRRDNLDSTPLPPDDTDTPPQVGSSKEGTASYLRDYPQIFMKKPSDIPLPSDITLSLSSEDRVGQSQIARNQTLSNDNDNTAVNRKSSLSNLSDENNLTGTEKPNTSHKSNSKDGTQKKLPTMSSDKSVSFKPMKTLKLDNENSNEKIEMDANNYAETEETDSLDTIIESMKVQGSKKEKSLNKDENNNRGLEESSSRQSNDTGGLTVMSEDENNTSDKATSTKLEKKRNGYHKKK